MSLSADHGRAVQQVRDDLAALVDRVRGLQRIAPEGGAVWTGLATLRNDFSVCLATANGAVATLGALRVTTHDRFVDGKCAAANDHDKEERA
jgi:hypothetical protein